MRWKDNVKAKGGGIEYWRLQASDRENWRQGCMLVTKSTEEEEGLL